MKTKEAPVSQNKKNTKPVIVCVDDEQFVLNVLYKQLQNRFGKNYEIEFAESAEEAINVINSLMNEGYPLVMVISDQIMPGMQGDEFLTYIHKKYPNPIKIMLTGQASLQSAISAINHADLYRYMTKPWQEEDFLLTVEKGLQQYGLYEQTKMQADVFSNFVPVQFLERLNKKSIIEIKLGDHVQREMSILFSDIGGFTKMSEEMTPEETYNFINKYLEYIEPAIQKNNGFIDKYIGDAVMALFDKPEDALKAAIDIQHNIRNFNLDHKDFKFFPISAHIGLHVGSLMLGIVGTAKRMQGTVISHAVNLASRLEGLANLFDCKITFSEDFLNNAGQINLGDYRSLGKVWVKGKNTGVSVFEFIGDFENNENKITTKKDFEEGLTLFFNKDFAEACVKFNAVLKVNPEDKPARIYLERSAYYMLHDQPDDWFIIRNVEK